MEPVARRSPWFYTGIACGGLLLVGLVAAAVAGYLGVRTVQALKEEERDPRRRTDRALRLLGAEKLPQGYHAAGNVPVPFLYDLVILADEPADETDAADRVEGIFVYLELRRFGAADGEDPLRLLEQRGFRWNGGETLKEGALTVDEQAIEYAVRRGSLRTDRGRSIESGLAALMKIRCRNDRRDRFALWVVPDPDPEAPPDAAGDPGTPVDPIALRSFMSAFRLCAD